MRNKNYYFIAFLSFAIFWNANSQSGRQLSQDNTWTFTYLKANNLQKEKLREFLEKNWFAMDSIAVTQGLIKHYELLENVDHHSNQALEWDFIVAVEYFTKGTYSDIAEKFEVIRKNHTIIKIDGLVLKDLGKVVKSETIKRNQYLK